MRRLYRDLIPLAAAALLLATAAAGAKDPPKRIISHLPNVTEICYALGLGDRLIGVSDFCHYPPEAIKKTRVGGMMNPDFETILSLKPDLAILMENQGELIARYKAAGIEVLAIKSDTVEQVYASIVAIGKAAGVSESAEGLVAKIRASLEEVRRATRDRPPVRTLLVIWHDPGSLQNLYVAGAGTFLDTLLGTAGGTNCLPELAAPFAKVSKEEILKQNPRAVLYVTSNEALGTAEQVARERQAWSSLKWLSAVKTGDIHVIAAEYAHTPGPRMVRIARSMARALHPDLFPGQEPNRPANEGNY